MAKLRGPVAPYACVLGSAAGDARRAPRTLKFALPAPLAYSYVLTGAELPGGRASPLQFVVFDQWGLVNATSYIWLRSSTTAERTRVYCEYL
jgi:hypothetical protein